MTKQRAQWQSSGLRTSFIFISLSPRCALGHRLQDPSSHRRRTRLGRPETGRPPPPDDSGSSVPRPLVEVLRYRAQVEASRVATVRVRLRGLWALYPLEAFEAVPATVRQGREVQVVMISCSLNMNPQKRQPMLSLESVTL